MTWRSTLLLVDHHHPRRAADAVLASLVGFVLARFSFRFNLTLLAVFLAAEPAAATVVAGAGVSALPDDSAALCDFRHRFDAGQLLGAIRN